MKDYKSIRQGIGSSKGEGIYDEVKDGSHRCVDCNKKMRTGQEAITESHPSYKGYRRTETFYYHKVC